MEESVDLRFSGPTKTWLDLCRFALRQWEKDIGKYEADEMKVAEYINRRFTK